MQRRFSLAALALCGASLILAGAALAQTFPQSYAQRCVPDALRAGPAPQDPCRLQIAHFGLAGPMVIGSRMVDVDATGSVESRQPGIGARPADRPSN